MAIRLGDEAPDFTADTTEGTIGFHDWKSGSWAVLFSHPKDYTPVCTTELGYMASIKGDFDARGVKLIAVSVDSVDDHEGWSADIAETQGTAPNYPIIGDPDQKVAQLYDMIHAGEGDTSTVRSVFVVDPSDKVRLTITYPKSVGRNFDEILRVVDALQLTDQYPVSTPVNWRDGDDVIVAPTLSDDEAAEKFPAGFETQKPYLRVTPQPNK